MAGKTKEKTFPGNNHSHNSEGLQQATNEPGLADLEGTLGESSVFLTRAGHLLEGMTPALLSTQRH